MIILPIGHEQSTARRWPWVTIAVVVVNVAVFLGVMPADAAAERGIDRTAVAAIEYLRAHPDLELKPPLSLLVRVRRTAPRDPAELTASERAQLETEQTQLDGLVNDFDAALHRISSYRFGFVPSEHRLGTLITHQFLHGGWMHLIGNLWFLWLVGCNVEDAWGRWLFPLFYLTAGVAGALAHAAGAWQSPLPLIGASGAIAGAMGAFLVRYATTKIRFFAWFFLRPFTFHVPAYVVLPFWLLVQVLSGTIDGGSGAGVAYWAHVGGFVYGVAFALVLRRSGVERRIDEQIERRGEVVQDARILQAGDLIGLGRAGEAVTILQRLLAEQPRNIDAELELLRAASACRDLRLERDTKCRLIEHYLQQSLTDPALQLYDELLTESAATSMRPALRLKLARELERRGALERAAAELDRLGAESDDALALNALIAHGEIELRRGRNDVAAALFRRATALSDRNPEFEQIVRSGLRRALGLSSIPPSRP